MSEPSESPEPENCKKCLRRAVHCRRCLTKCRDLVALLFDRQDFLEQRNAFQDWHRVCLKSKVAKLNTSSSRATAASEANTRSGIQSSPVSSVPCEAPTVSRQFEVDVQRPQARDSDVDTRPPVARSSDVHDVGADEALILLDITSQSAEINARELLELTAFSLEHL